MEHLLIWIRGNLALAISGTKYVFLSWIQDESAIFIGPFSLEEEVSTLYDCQSTILNICVKNKNHIQMLGV